MFLINGLGGSLFSVRRFRQPSKHPHVAGLGSAPVQHAIWHVGDQPTLLAIASDIALGLTELKRDRIPREMVAQALEYAPSMAELTDDRMMQTCRRFSKGGSLGLAFQYRVSIVLDEETLNHACNRKSSRRQNRTLPMSNRGLPARLARRGRQGGAAANKCTGQC